MTPAQAEGSRTSYIAGWDRGWESNRWYDNNYDGNATGVGFGSCYTDSSFNSATIALYQDISASPDRGYGNRTNYCNYTSWSRPGKGSFYFKLSDFSGGTRLNVDDVNIDW
ncbi:hypothetical protein ABT237_22285 [Streptomyces sp. NPDC001581]|uniref:hypothetical protein n=1 Tax=Streptomyces sp. NPDC001581 TaxID=3154386 RepID=UPI0033294A0A